MLDLDSPLWKEIKEYFDDGVARYIGEEKPIEKFLRRLWNNEKVSDRDWTFDFIDVHCCRGWLSQASFASVAHLVALAAKTDPKDRIMFFLAIMLIEYNRERLKISIEPFLEKDYFDAIDKVNGLVLECLQLKSVWSSENFQILFATLAILDDKLDLADFLIDGHELGDQHKGNG
jgi:hypothetical protein